MRWLIAGLVVANVAVYVGLEYNSAKIVKINQRNISSASTAHPSIILLDERADSCALQQSARDVSVKFISADTVDAVAQEKPSTVLNGSELTKPITMCWLVQADRPASDQDTKISRSNIKRTLSQVGDWLDTKSVDSHLVESELSVLIGYLIYLPVATSPDAAITQLEQLSSHGYDAFMFKSGTLQGAISLGMYKNESGAVLARQRFVQQGYSAKVKPYYQQAPIWQLQVATTLASDAVFTSTVWALKQNEFSGLLIDKKSCQGVAHQSDLE